MEMKCKCGGTARTQHQVAYTWVMECDTPGCVYSVSGWYGTEEEVVQAWLRKQEADDMELPDRSRYTVTVRTPSQEELDDWLKVAEGSFDFWNNDKDAIYDALKDARPEDIVRLCRVCWNYTSIKDDVCRVCGDRNPYDRDLIIQLISTQSKPPEEK